MVDEGFQSIIKSFRKIGDPWESDVLQFSTHASSHHLSYQVKGLVSRQLQLKDWVLTLNGPARSIKEKKSVYYGSTPKIVHLYECEIRPFLKVRSWLDLQHSRIGYRHIARIVLAF